MEKPIVKIRDWTIFGGQLFGKVTGHPNKNIPDGGFVRTSKIERLETANTIYEPENWIPGMTMGSDGKVQPKNVD